MQCAHGIADQVRGGFWQAFSAVSSQDGTGEALLAAFFGALAFFAGAFATSGFFTALEASADDALGAAAAVGGAGVAGEGINGA